MAERVPARLVWAVETLAVAPDEQILEVGCRHGLAVGLVCAKLDSGRITAIDRSAKMIAAAAQRNRAWVAAGKATFQQAALAQADLGGATFDKIFAVRVNVFWQEPSAELAAVRRLLAPGGKLYLFNQPPSAAQLPRLMARLTANLSAGGFGDLTAIVEDGPGSPNVCPNVCVVAACE